MRRRQLILNAGAAIALPFSARAQQTMRPMIGWLSVFAASESPPQRVNMAAFKDGLREFGFVEGENVSFEYRWTGGHNERFADVASEFVAQRVDLIVAAGGPHRRWRRRMRRRRSQLSSPPSEIPSAADSSPASRTPAGT